MAKHKKPVGEIIAGLIIVAGALGLVRASFTSNSYDLFTLFLAVPVMVVGFVVLLSKDATKSGETIFRLFSKLFG